MCKGSLGFKTSPQMLSTSDDVSFVTSISVCNSSTLADINHRYRVRFVLETKWLHHKLVVPSTRFCLRRSFQI